MSSEFISCKEMINRVFENLDSSKADTIMDLWRATVSKIYNVGEKLAAHSRVIDLKNGVLLIEADHPGWIQLLQLNKAFILKGLKSSSQDIKTLAFRLKGSNIELYEQLSEENSKRSQEKYLKELDKTGEKLEQMGYKASETNEELPPELAKVFQELKNSMLTNDSK